MKHASITLNSTEADNMVASFVRCEAIWLHKLIVEFTNQRLEPTVVYNDNQSCMRLFENLVVHYCSKHIDIRYYSLMDKVQKGAVIVNIDN
jgi:hypothetical protein